MWAPRSSTDATRPSASTPFAPNAASIARSAVSAVASPSVSAKIDGPRAGDRAAECARVERGLLDGVKSGNQRRANGLGDSIVDGTAQNGGIIHAECGDHRRDRGCLRQRRRAIDAVGEELPRALRGEREIRSRDREAQPRRHRHANELERIDVANQQNPAEQTRRDVVDMTTGDVLFSGECGAHERAIIERTAEQRVRRERTGDG